MSVTRRVGWMWLAIVLVFGTGMTVWASEEEIPVNKVPPALMEAVKKALPKVKWTGATKYNTEGEISYTLEGEDGMGRGVWADIYDDGTLGEISREIALKAVPPVVLKALKTRMPRFQPSGVYEVREDGQVIRYDFEGKRPKDKEDIGVSVSADGKEIEIDE